MEIRVWSDSLFINILNGREVKHGGKSTWQNPQGQRVPLKEGRVQLKLEGSEIQFRNWEIRLLKQDHLYGEWYVEGCRDPACKEYSASANLHIQTLCLTPVPVSLGKSVPGFHAPGTYGKFIYNVRGREVAQYIREVPGK